MRLYTDSESFGIARHRFRCASGVLLCQHRNVLLWRDSSYRNTSEFVASVIGLYGLCFHVPGGHNQALAVELRGDSITSLSWAEKARVKSNLASNASMVFTLLLAVTGIRVARKSHISGEDNWLADMLSRGMTLDDIVERDARFSGIPKLEFPMDELLDLCNPRHLLSSDEEFGAFWGRIQSSLKVTL